MTKMAKNKKYDYPEVIVGALIINDEGKIFLAKSGKWKDKWTVFGGHVELGEKAEEAIIREVKEEAGIDVQIEAQLDFSESVFHEDFKGDRHFIFLDFLCRYDGKGEIKLNEEYSGEYEWMTIDEAKKMNLAIGTKQIIEKYLKYKEQKNLLDGWKRCQADFENYKKMQAESQKEFIKYAGQNIVLQIIPVLDNFHMSTDHIPEDQKDGGWVVGIMHIQKQLENVLAENGVEEIETKVGDKFNPEIHEAMQSKEEVKGDKIHPVKSSQSEVAEGEFNRVKKVVMKGYKMGDKIIRPVKVIVG